MLSSKQMVSEGAPKTGSFKMKPEARKESSSLENVQNHNKKLRVELIH